MQALFPVTGFEVVADMRDACVDLLVLRGGAHCPNQMHWRGRRPFAIPNEVGVRGANINSHSDGNHTRATGIVIIFKRYRETTARRS
jgi:hypothetical protein